MKMRCQMVAILSSDVLPEIRFTVDEYLQADLPEGQRYELVDGVVEMTPIQGPLHDHSLSVLCESLYAYRRNRPEAFDHISQRAGVAIPTTATVREPDLAVYRGWANGPSDWTRWKDLPPIWVAEVISPGQQRRDYEEKRRDYRLAGVREYWIIDRQARRVTVLVRGDSDWAETVFAEGEEARSTCLPEFRVAVARLIGGGE